jgi:hypothetical protein
MKYLIANESHISGVISLQEKNLVTNLTEEQKVNGFVTTPFSKNQLVDLIQQKGLFVVQDGNDISGYAAAAGWSYFEGRPMFDYMIRLFQELNNSKYIITKENSFQYGPVCIDINRRGTDTFQQLFSFMKNEMGIKYEIGTTFINKVNQRSYRAHTEKAELEVINEFSFNGNNYYGLAFMTNG